MGKEKSKEEISYLEKNTKEDEIEYEECTNETCNFTVYIIILISYFINKI